LAVVNYGGIGRRKTSVARVWLKPGSRKIVVNKRRNFEEYFPNEFIRRDILRPLEVTGTMGKFGILVNVNGGGLVGQAEAVRLGIARALLKVDEEFKSLLRKQGLLTRDPRMKERKKYGQKGARAKFQFSKR